MQETKVVIGGDLLLQLHEVGKAEEKPLAILVDGLIREALELRRDREAFVAEFERERCPF
jgi:hypothetical protein